MSIFNRKSATVVDTLTAKATEKVANGVNKQEVANTLISQATDLRNDAQVDAAHAAAIAQAAAILANAGVTI